MIWDASANPTIGDGGINRRAFKAWKQGDDLETIYVRADQYAILLGIKYAFPQEVIPGKEMTYESDWYKHKVVVK